MEELLEVIPTWARWLTGALVAVALGVMGNLLTPWIRALPTLVKSGRRASQLEAINRDIQAQILADEFPQAALAAALAALSRLITLAIVVSLMIQLVFSDAAAKIAGSDHREIARMMLVYLAVGMIMFATGPFNRRIRAIMSPGLIHEGIAERAAALGLEIQPLYDNARAKVRARHRPR